MTVKKGSGKGGIGGKGPPRGPGRVMKLRNNRGRSASSARWLKRQLSDPYVHEARRLGYRSRAAFKLVEIDDRFHILSPGAVVIDLGAAPGGWTQVVAARVKAGESKGGVVIAVDSSEMAAVPGARVMCLDFTSTDAPDAINAALGQAKVNVVLSDMAAPATGHTQTDHLRIVALCEAALAFAIQVLQPDGAFVAKVLRGGSEQSLLTEMKRAFAKVRHFKPKASRADSAEMYVVATGFRGRERLRQD